MNKNFPLRLRKRAEFLAVRTGEKRRGKYFLLEVKRNTPSIDAIATAQNQSQNNKKNTPKDLLAPRVGFTVTRKNGNAVKRNRIKRRLREALRVGIMQGDIALMRDIDVQTDYVIVARQDALNAPFKKLTSELQRRMNKNSNL